MKILWFENIRPIETKKKVDFGTSRKKTLISPCMLYRSKSKVRRPKELDSTVQSPLEVRNKSAVTPSKSSDTLNI